jgi:hypothetical protein
MLAYKAVINKVIRTLSMGVAGVSGGPGPWPLAPPLTDGDLGWWLASALGHLANASHIREMVLHL